MELDCFRKKGNRCCLFNLNNTVKMGIEGLWDILKPAGETHYLGDYCEIRTIKKQDTTSPPSKFPVVGIDASIWMHETAAVFNNRNHSNRGENPELRTLLFRVWHLCHMCNTPVFVFDGIGRPERKRGRKVFKSDHWIANRFKEIIEASGLNHHQAPGEAESELAALNRSGKVDFVLTTDSDTPIFRARRTAKSARDYTNDTTKRSTKDRIEVYDANIIETHPEVLLSVGGLLLIALLVGGDYDNGITGCGVTIAHGLARAGLGDSLRNAYLSMTPANFKEFRVQWRITLCTELAKNPHGYLSRKQPALSRKIPLHFPNPRIIGLYTRPTVSPQHVIDGCDWTSRDVNLPRLIRLCEQLFTWGDAAGIAATFRRHVFGGMAVRQLAQYDKFGINTAVEDAAVIYPALFRVKQKARTTSAHTTQRYILRVYIDHLQQRIPLHLEHNRPENPIPDDLEIHFIDFHAPAFLVDPIRSMLTLGAPKQISKGLTKGRKVGLQGRSTKGKEKASLEISDLDEEDDATPPPTISLWPSSSRSVMMSNTDQANFIDLTADSKLD